jgi:hypothetical protein
MDLLHTKEMIGWTGHFERKLAKGRSDDSVAGCLARTRSHNARIGQGGRNRNSIPGSLWSAALTKASSMLGVFQENQYGPNGASCHFWDGASPLR